MNRQEKVQVVDLVKQLFSESQATFLVGYKGLDVDSMQSLRRELRASQAVLKVTKARLMKIAAQDIEGVDQFTADFKDQVGLVFAKADVSVVAKKLVEFSKENDSLAIVSGFFESRMMTKAEVTALASLPSREVLLAMVAGTVQAPMTKLVFLLNLMIVRLLVVLQKASEKGE